MSRVATGYYAVCKGSKVGVFTTWDEAQSYVQGFPGAKFKKFKTLPEAEQWYKANLPQNPANPQSTTSSPATSTVASFNAVPTSPSSAWATPVPSESSSIPTPRSLSKPSTTSSSNVSVTSASSSGATRVPSKPPLTPASKPLPQSISRALSTPAPGPVQPPRIAAPKNTTVDIVYSDGACKSNGARGATAGVGVWWGPNDPRNISERCPGVQTNNRAELIAIARVLETVPLSTNTLIIRTDSQYSIKALTDWSYNWRKNGWRTAGGKPVSNKELIDYVLFILETRHRSGQPVQLEYVKGHSGDTGNDGADALAVAGCGRAETPERDWESLKGSYNLEQDIMADLLDFDPEDFFLSDEDLMKELEEDN